MVYVENAEFINTILQGDCLELMKQLDDRSVDMILCDLPYGVSNNEWDKPINLDDLWTQYNRIIKPHGAIALTAVQPFATDLIDSQRSLFRYDLIWVKTVSSGNLNANRQPLRTHEHILIFYKNQPVYNQQYREGKPYKTKRSGNYNGAGYGDQKYNERNNDGRYHPISVLDDTTVVRFSNPRIRGGHPTQKPVELFEYLIRTYTNEGDLVLDNCIGSGTTAVAAVNSDRKFIGMETLKEYCDVAKSRVEKAISDKSKSFDKLKHLDEWI